jgi:hypothetical protein
MLASSFAAQARWLGGEAGGIESRPDVWAWINDEMERRDISQKFCANSF